MKVSVINVGDLSSSILNPKPAIDIASSGIGFKISIFICLALL